MKIRASLILVAACLASTSCVNLKPKPDTTKVYTLGPISHIEPKPVSSDAHGLYVALPDLPGFTGGNKLKYRKADGELKSLSSVRWAESLDEGIARALADYLSLSGESIKGYYPWPYVSRDIPKLTVDFYKLTAYADGTVQFVANWQLAKGEGEIASGRFVSNGITWDSSTASSYVASFNEGLKQLTEAITAEL